MPAKPVHRIGDLQLRILRVLWDRGEASVADVLAGLDGEHAYTTIATMLRKMEDRGLVRHREVGRKFVYRADVSASDVSQGLSSRLIDRLFAGSIAGAVSHLLETREIDPAELEELERLLKEHRNRAEKKSRRSDRTREGQP